MMRGLIMSFLSWVLLISCTSGQTLNGFDLSDASIPVSQIRGGGPPRDGIPSIDKPIFQTPDSADWLRPDDRILGIELNGVSRAYPIAILNWHEVVNDVIDGQQFAVTYCPLCGTGMAFDASVDGENLIFGVSGLLFESDVLLFDRQSESLWSQIWSEAVSGPHKGKHLQTLPLAHTTWSAWQQSHPDTQVLSRATGISRDYTQDPYAGYADSPRTMFPVVNRAPKFMHAKAWVLGISIDGKHRAYPFEELRARGDSDFVDELAGESFTITWDEANRSATMIRDGEVQPTVTAFWFAWYAFHTDTEVFKAE